MNTSATLARAAPVELLPPGADRNTWLATRRNGIGASEIAAVLGISPWDSRFSLFWRKRNGWDTEVNDEMSAGTRLEASIATWWRDETDQGIETAGLYRHPERPWQLATPDRLVLHECESCAPFGGCGTARVVAVLECKYVAYSWDGWGEPGTDDIPVYYRAQVLWQCDVIGVDEWHLAALGPGGFRAYHGQRDEADLRVMRAAGACFWADLQAGNPPDVDAHNATAAALKRLHPTVQDYDVDVPLDLAEGYRRARALRARVEAVVDRYEARIRAAIGDGRRAMCNRRLVASRSVYDQGTDQAELTALDDDWPVVDRLNPGRSASYASR